MVLELHNHHSMTTRRAWCAWLLAIAYFTASGARAEYYVAGQVGVNFADRLTGIQGTGSFVTQSGPDLDLKNAVVYGGKLGFYPGNGATGVELDVFNSQPNIKNLDNIPGIHLGVTNVGLNLLLRYPGQTFQPYVGFGGALLIARISQTVDVQSDTDVGFGINLLGGLRTFITPYVAIFAEYKYTRGTLSFNEAFGPTGGFSGSYHAQHMVFGVSYHF
jgi:opacity protein-like surface antigen